MKLVRKGDLDHDGCLSLQEFRNLMISHEFKTYFELRGIDIKDTEMFFEMLTIGSGNKNDKVQISLFVWACLRMKGVATSLDLHSMDFELRLMHQTTRRTFQHCVELLEKIADRQAQTTRRAR